MDKYEHLMKYIAEHSGQPSHIWCARLREHETAALGGGFAEVAQDLEGAQAAFAARQKANGHDPYPYNRSMGLFLGIPIKENGEPQTGYYMASCVMHHYRCGVARRRAAEMIEASSPLTLVVARDRKTGAPKRFTTFVGPDQIVMGSDAVMLNNGKYAKRFTSNWSVEACFERLVAALERGTPLNEAA